MTTNERIGHILVALPIAHVLGASLFLWSYCLGFGANLIAHAKVADLFSVSIGDMVRAYIFSLFVPIAFTSYRLTSRYPYAISRAAALTDPEERTRAENSNQRARTIILRMVYGMAALVSSMVIYQAAYGYRINLVALYIGVLPAILASVMLFSERAGLAAMQFEVISTVAVFCGSLFFQGITEGDSDRHRSYEYASKHYTMCNRAAIVRSFSENFLAVLPGDRKALISGDCKVKYRVSAPTAERRAPSAAPAKPTRKTPLEAGSGTAGLLPEKSRAKHERGLTQPASPPSGSPHG
ncbi:hypothetical protein [Novosphingobium sp. 11B]